MSLLVLLVQTEPTGEGPPLEARALMALMKGMNKMGEEPSSPWMMLLDGAPIGGQGVVKQ